MTTKETFDIPLEAAEIYEARFVPGIFAEWAPLLVDAADVRAGHAVLDVACGTGIVARTAADRIGSDGVVIGVDLNEAMLTVARRVRPELDWQHGDAGALPFPRNSFDAVLCQMALMFFPDRGKALAEMARVAAPGGTIGLVVPAGIADQPAYGPLLDVVADEAGQDAANVMQTYWSCGSLDLLSTLLDAAGLRITSTRTHLGTAGFGSADELVATEIEGSPIISHIDAATYTRIRERARETLRPFESADGAMRAPLRGHIVTATVP